VRWEAIRKVCVSLNIRVNPELVVQLEGMDPGSEPGYVATKKLLTRKERFTAIFAFNDASAIGAITALHEAGLHVPRKISVVGFDDIPTAATIRPALTTVRQPLYEMGQMAAMNLMRLIPRRGNSDPLPDSILVSPTFVRRHSTDKAVSD
jgi:LacI family transcriptional regulator